MELQNTFLADLQAKIVATPSIRAAWLEGSFGRGNADRYSDIDLHLVVENLEEFRTNAQAWLAEIRPLVLFKLLFDGRMINALTVDGLRFDAWLYPQAPALLDPNKAQVLYNPDSRLTFGFSTATPPAVDPIALRAQIEEFWRCISLLPTVIGRQEWIVSLQGLTIELNIVLDLLMRGYGIQRDTGVKTLNRFLPEALRHEIEAALALEGLTAASLTRSHLGLAQIVQQHGRTLATQHGFAYPSDLEKSVLQYVQRELGLLGL